MFAALLLIQVIDIINLFHNQKKKKSIFHLMNFRPFFYPNDLNSLANNSAPPFIRNGEVF